MVVVALVGRRKRNLNLKFLGIVRGAMDVANVTNEIKD
jgi:hypothetical protein